MTEEKIQQSIIDGTKAAKMVTDRIKAPMKLAYEKVLNRLILITKKRYGNLYEEDLILMSVSLWV